MSLLKKLFGGTSVDFKTLVKEGAMIIDVRSPAEFNGGHVIGAVNIPLQAIQSSFNKIPKNKVSILKSAGYTVHNGGGWMSLKSKL
jgi:rhodanese-related sulfurtransferase